VYVFNGIAIKSITNQINCHNERERKYVVTKQQRYVSRSTKTYKSLNITKSSQSPTSRTELKV